VHTLNKFKNKVKAMTPEERQETLKDLQASLMLNYTKSRKGNVGHDNVRLIRRKIAMVKTFMNVKGYHYKGR